MLNMSRAALSLFFLASALAAPVAQDVVVAMTTTIVVTQAGAAPTQSTTFVPAPSVGVQENVKAMKHRRPGKRGLAYNDAGLASPFLHSKKISWAYNWGSSSSGLSHELEFVPMLWGSSSGSWSSDASNALKTGSHHLLGFNEPDNTGQANMSPQTAASLWKANIEPFHGKAWLGSPAVTNGGSPMGLTWLSQFFDACSDCHAHFIALHWYDSYSNVDYFKNYFTQAHQQFPTHPIWITEFGTTDGNDQQIAGFLQEVLPWLDSQPWIHRYAYFMDSEGKLISNGGLSQSGQVYST